MSDTPKQCDKFQGRRLKNYINAQVTVTEDPEIIETVSCLKLDNTDNHHLALPLVI